MAKRKDEARMGFQIKKRSELGTACGYFHGCIYADRSCLYCPLTTLTETVDEAVDIHLKYQKMTFLEWIGTEHAHLFEENNKVNQRDWITSAFDWEDSEEGHSFWADRDFTWKQHCKGKKWKFK